MYKAIQLVCFSMMRRFRSPFISIILFFLFLSPIALTQNSMNTEGFGQKWVNINDVDVSLDQITVEAFITRQNNMNIVSKHDGTTDCNYLLRPNSFQISTTDGFFICLNTFPLTTNIWYHVAGTYDGSFVRYYVNGCLVNEIEASGELITNSWDAAIGTKSNWPNGPEQFRGKIDEVRIWNEARSDLQLRLNMNNLINPTGEPQLIAYYKMDNSYNNVQGTSSFNGSPVGSPIFDVEHPLFIPFSVISIQSTDLSCFESSDGTINVIATGGNLEFSLDGTNYTNSPEFLGLTAGSYTVYSRSGACEESQTVVLIEPDDIPTPEIFINDPICSTDTLFLSTAQVTGANYFWDGPNGLSSVDFEVTIPDLDTINSGAYSIYLELDGCYSDTVTEDVVVNQSYDISLIDTICSNETFTFGPQELNVSGNYIQNLQTAAGCDSIVQLDLTVNPAYSFVIDTSICEGESILFEGLEMTMTGTYPFNLFTSLGCDSIITYELIVHPIPAAPLLTSNSPLSCPGDSYEVIISTVADASYLWTGPNAFTSDVSDITFAAAIEDMGVYSVTATLNGCVSPSSETELAIINIYSFDDFDLPNVLTPNNDGANDVFDLESYFKTCQPYEVVFFDRWGIVVYQHRQNGIPFSGISLDGSELMDGVYLFKINLEEGIKHGFVHLLR